MVILLVLKVQISTLRPCFCKNDFGYLLGVTFAFRTRHYTCAFTSRVSSVTVAAVAGDGCFTVSLSITAAIFAVDYHYVVIQDVKFMSDSHATCAHYLTLTVAFVAYGKAQSNTVATVTCTVAAAQKTGYFPIKAAPIAPFTLDVG